MYSQQNHQMQPNNMYSQQNQQMQQTFIANMTNEYKQLQEYQLQMANEIKRLKDQMVTNTVPSNGNFQEYINQINNLNAEISQYKNINGLLNKQVEDFKNKTSGTLDAGKIEKIEEKKKEIKAELEKLREKHESIENMLEQQNVVSEQLTQKRSEILELMNKYDYKIFGSEHDIVIKYSEMKRINEHKPVYRFVLPYKFENVNQITLIDQNFNENMFNVTPYNNKLILGDIGNYESCVDKIEDINYKVYNSNGKNILDITLEPGKYDLDTMMTRFNDVLNKYNIEIGYDPTKFIIQIRTKQNNNNKFQMIKDEYDIYTLMGFDVFDESNTKFKGKKSVDLKITKNVDCYMMNIKHDKGFKINVPQNRIINNVMIIKPKIEKLGHIDFYFIGENGRPYWQEYNDFNFTISIKGDIAEDKNKYINVITISENSNDENNRSEDDNLLENINKMLM